LRETDTGFHKTKVVLLPAVVTSGLPSPARQRSRPGRVTQLIPGRLKPVRDFARPTPSRVSDRATRAPARRHER